MQQIGIDCTIRTTRNHCEKDKEQNFKMILPTYKQTLIPKNFKIRNNAGITNCLKFKPPRRDIISSLVSASKLSDNNSSLTPMKLQETYSTAMVIR